MVDKVKQILAVVATIAFVVNTVFAYIPYSPVFPSVSLCASAPPRETNISAFTNSEGHVYRMTYDGQGRLIAATNAMTEQVFRNYFDPCGNLTNKVDGASRPIRFQYDLLNHCTNTIYSDGSTEAFTFDAVGNLLTAKNAATTNTFGYNNMNQLTVSVSRVAGITFTNLYRYDLGGLATNVVYPDGKTVRYAFDPDGNVTNVIDWANHTWRITRDAAGRIATLAYPNNVTGAWGYDASSAVTNWSYTGGDGGLPGRRITRDLMGLKTVEKVTSGPMPVLTADRRTENIFNAADRLVSAQVFTGTNQVTQTFLYNGCGALTNQSSASVSLATYSYDLASRLTSTTASNLSFSASYDALGNRVKTTLNDTPHLWVIDHTDPLKRPLMETTTNGTPVRYYVWGAGRLLAVIDGDGTTRYAHCDDFGSVVALSDANGATVFTAAYGPYGEPWGSTGTNATPFRWLGGHGVFAVLTSDLCPLSSGLYLTRHRAYDTTLKRFLSTDPLGLGGGANLYSYALGNPLSYLDPYGLCAKSGDGFWENLAQGGRQISERMEHDPSLVIGMAIPVGTVAKVEEVLATGLRRLLSAIESEAKDLTYLYQKVGAEGEHLKFGITRNPATRYTQEELAGGKLRIVGQGSREEMLQLERNIHETLPIGPEEAQKFYIQKQVEKGLTPPPYGGN